MNYKLYNKLVKTISESIYNSLNEDFFDELDSDELISYDDDILINSQMTQFSIGIDCERYADIADLGEIISQTYNDILDVFNSYESEHFMFEDWKTRTSIGDSTGAPVSTIKYSVTIYSALNTEDATNFLFDIIDILRDIDSDVFRNEAFFAISLFENNEIKKYESYLSIDFNDEPDYTDEDEIHYAIKSLTGGNYDIEEMNKVIKEREPK